MAVDGVTSMKVCDITQCSICLEAFKEPKALPCIHTFCLQCLDSYCNLPNNFFILQLLQVNQSSGAAKNESTKVQRICEQCLNSGSEATSYCIECEQHICNGCAGIHTNAKVCRFHQVVREADIPCVTERMNLKLGYCDQHPAEQIRLFCIDCQMVTCQLCIVNKHKKHNLTDVNESAEQFREQLKEDVDNVAACALMKLENIKQVEVSKSVLKYNVKAAQREILQKFDELVAVIQLHKSQLMEELNEYEERMLKEVSSEKDEIEREFVIRESFKRYCQEMMNKGTACDISRTARDLHARAQELVKTQEEPDCRKLSRVKITFKPSPSTTDGVKNVIGELVFSGAAANTVGFNASPPFSGTAEGIGSINVEAATPSTSGFGMTATVASATDRVLHTVVETPYRIKPTNTRNASTSVVSDTTVGIGSMNTGAFIPSTSCFGTTPTVVPPSTSSDFRAAAAKPLRLDKTDSIAVAQKFDFRRFLGKLAVLHLLPGSMQYITGITVLGSEVFVIQDTSPVYVYKFDDFTWIRNLTISGSTQLRGLVSSPRHNSLYIGDWKQKIVYRYNLANNVTTSWPLSGRCCRLSLTKLSNVLVTLYDTKRIVEYTQQGWLIREISLDNSIDRPWHSIQLSTGSYVVCHEGEQHRVCIVDQKGQIIQSCGVLGAGGQLNSPRHLAVDCHDNVLVADCKNSTVHLLSPTLTYLGDIKIPDHQLRGPYSLHFDEQTRRLFIGEWDVGRIFVLEINV